MRDYADKGYLSGKRKLWIGFRVLCYVGFILTAGLLAIVLAYCAKGE